MYKSQAGQDIWVSQILNYNNGVFIDIGANSGIKNNNSFFLESKKNWTGVCVEPNLEMIKDLKSVRKCDIAQYALTNHTGTAVFRDKGSDKGRSH